MNDLQFDLEKITLLRNPKVVIKKIQTVDPTHVRKHWREVCVCLCRSLSLPLSQPFMPILLPSGHTLHFKPFTPVLQEHRPDICSQSSRTEPVASHLHAAAERAERNKGGERLMRNKNRFNDRKKD